MRVTQKSIKEAERRKARDERIDRAVDLLRELEQCKAMNDFELLEIVATLLIYL